MRKILTAVALTLAVVAPAAAQDKPATATTGQPAATTPALTPKTDTKATQPTQVKAEAKLININTASATELEGLSKTHSKAIIAGRPYKAVDELLSKKVLSQDAFDAIKTKVSVK
jgi:DNA uptake protein ComE-like DNA-binding protein